MDERPRDRRRAYRHLAIVALWAITAASACATSGSVSGTSGDDPKTKAYAAWADCARSHGANVGRPEFQPDGSVRVPPGAGPLSSVEALRSAMSACQPILAAAGLGPPGVVDLTSAQLATLTATSKAFATCMTSRGYPMPEPTWQGGAITNWKSLDFDLNSASVQTAGTGCAQSTGFDPLLAHAARD